MKTETKLNKVINQVVTILNSEQLEPQQVRYVFKKVREAGKFSIPNRPKRLPDFLNPSEIYIILKEASENKLDSILIGFLIKTGVRIGEARNMLIQDLDFANNQLKVVQGKGSKDRYIPLELGLQRELLQYIDGRKSGYLFANKGKPFTVRGLQKRVTNVIKRCNFTKKLHTHSLRHTFACLCLAKGLSKEQVQLLMGHSSIKNTEIYARLELSGVKEDFIRLMGS